MKTRYKKVTGKILFPNPAPPPLRAHVDSTRIRLGALTSYLVFSKMLLNLHKNTAKKIFCVMVLHYYYYLYYYYYYYYYYCCCCCLAKTSKI